MRLKLKRARRLRLRTRVLAGVLAITLTTLVAFDIAVVTGSRHYLLNQTDTRLRSIVNLYQRANVNWRVIGPPTAAAQRCRGSCPGTGHAKITAVPKHCQGPVASVKNCPKIFGPGTVDALPPALLSFLVGI